MTYLTKLSSCFGINYKKNKSKIHNHDFEECFICNEEVDQEIDLVCGHKIHAGCLKKWWMHNPRSGMVCPYCRERSYDCFLEINSNTKQPVSFFRQDNQDYPLIIILNESAKGKKNEFIRIQQDGRELAQTTISLRAEIIYYISSYQSQLGPQPISG